MSEEEKERAAAAAATEVKEAQSAYDEASTQYYARLNDVSEGHKTEWELSDLKDKEKIMGEAESRLTEAKKEATKLGVGVGGKFRKRRRPTKKRHTKTRRPTKKRRPVIRRRPTKKRRAGKSSRTR